MKNNPATFQRFITQCNTVLARLDSYDVYVDDAIIYSANFNHHLQKTRAFFDRLTKAELTISLE